mgnify:CR=1 FL=1|jgi:catechol 2,3-dioxygenase-like lactoylglutathione lyase family enzyme
MQNLGLRHVALRVKDAQKSKAFYCDFFDMQVEWEPDAKNVYLTTHSQDNLALHEEEVPENTKQGLDHIGFIFASVAAVKELYQIALVKNIPIAKEPKGHRDGAYSFYLKDPDGYVVQVIYHPPIAVKNP